MDGVVDVRPLRGDVDDVAAEIDQQLHRQHHRLHAAGRDGGTLDRDGTPVQVGLVGRQRLDQRPHAPHVRDVEGVAAVERGLGGVADEGRRDDVALAVPERDDVAHLAGTHRQRRDVLGPQILDLRADAGQRIALRSIGGIGGFQRGHGRQPVPGRGAAVRDRVSPDIARPAGPSGGETLMDGGCGSSVYCSSLKFRRQTPCRCLRPRLSLGS